MNTDIRLSCGFWSHPKTKRLVKRLGLEGVRSLQILWLWAAQERPSGCLSGMDAEDIELAADWDGEDGKFFSECLGRWIDESEEGFCLHDWEDHNAWASEADNRSDTARLSRLARVNKEAAAGLRADGRTGITKDEYRLYAEGTPYERRITVPTTPAPTPTLRKEKTEEPPIPPVGVEGGESLPPHSDSDPETEQFFDPEDIPSLEFEQFFDAYPKQVDKAKAWNAWRKLGRVKPGLASLQAAIVEQSQSDQWTRDHGRYIPSPAKWLAERKWLDKLSPAPTSPAAGQTSDADWKRYAGSCVKEQTL